MSLHYVVKHNMCQTVHNHSNASIKRHDKLTVKDKHITTMFTVFAFGIGIRIKMLSPLFDQ